MPPTLREAAEEIMLAAKESAKKFFPGRTLDEYINSSGWTNPHWTAGFNMLREAIAAYDAAEATRRCATEVAATLARPAAVWHQVIGADNPPPVSALPPIRMTERRDPCSADARGEWTDFD